MNGNAIFVGGFQHRGQRLRSLGTGDFDAVLRAIGEALFRRGQIEQIPARVVLALQEVARAFHGRSA